MRLLRLTVAGVQYRDLNDLQGVTVNCPVRLAPEPTNPHDPNAIQVFSHSLDAVWDWRHVGYIPAKHTAPVHRLLKFFEILGVDCDRHGVIDSAHGEGSNKRLRIKLTLQLDANIIEEVLCAGFPDVVDASVIPETVS